MKQRFNSILTNDFDSCYYCGAPAADVHHIFHGTSGNKKLSEETGCVIPLCRMCHSRVHHVGGELDHVFKEDAQRQILINIFGRCYL